MKKPLRKIWSRDMIRPLIYKTFTRVILALTASLLWNRFVNRGQLLSMRAYAFLFFGILFGVAAWMSYLRLDGLHAPQFDKKLFDWKRPPKRSGGDMIDYVDEKVVSFDELDADEQNWCLLLANGACCVIFTVISLL